MSYCQRQLHSITCVLHHVFTLYHLFRKDAYKLIQEFEFGRLLDGRAVAAGKIHVGPGDDSNPQVWQDGGDEKKTNGRDK